MSNNGKDLTRALRALNDLGYAVDAFIINAVHWVPQSRPRLFIVATRDDGVKRAPEAEESEIRPKRLVQFINSRRSIRWRLRDLPALPKAGKSISSIMEKLHDDDPHWWSQQRAEYFLSQMNERHRAKADIMIADKKTAHATAFRRVRNHKTMVELRTDGTAGCLRTPRGGSARQILFVAGRGKYRVRLLTARECARLQGAPDTFPIDVPLNQSLFGFGDAVCVPVLEWIANHYLTSYLCHLLYDNRIHGDLILRSA